MYSETVFLICAGAGRTAPDPWYIYDTLETCRIYYIHDGRAIWSSGEAAVELRKGMLYFFPPNLPFSAAADPTFPLVHTYFDFMMTPPIILDHIISLDTQKHPFLRHLIEAADSFIYENGCNALYEHTGTVSSDSLLCCLNGILNYLPLAVPDLQYVSDADILTALNLIHTSYHTDITVRQIAKNLGYHEDYFIRKFKQIMKITPYRYLKSIRLHEAVRLRKSGMQYTQIADAVGYGDAASLCHALKKSVLDKDS